MKKSQLLSKPTVNQPSSPEFDLQSALEAGEIGVWDWDLTNDRMCWSEQMFRNVGLDSDASGHLYQRLLAAIHPNDQQSAPTSALPLLPFAFRDSKAVFAALDGALGEQIRGELAQHGIHAFRHCLQNGFHHLTTSTRPIHTAADLAGLKIRSPGGAIARDFFEAFGAEAGYAPFSQMYDALKARNFDGQSDPLGVVLSLKLYEVQTYLSLTAHWWSGFTLLANAAAWRALPQEIQQVVERNARNSRCYSARTSNRSTPPAPNSSQAEA